MKSISLLLGAGFSAPMGYPIGNDLNEKLLACKMDRVALDDQDRLILPNKENDSKYGHTSGGRL